MRSVFPAKALGGCGCAWEMHPEVVHATKVTQEQFSNASSASTAGARVEKSAGERMREVLKNVVGLFRTHVVDKFTETGPGVAINALRLTGGSALSDTKSVVEKKIKSISGDRAPGNNTPGIVIVTDLVIARAVKKREELLTKELLRCLRDKDPGQFKDSFRMDLVSMDLVSIEKQKVVQDAVADRMKIFKLSLDEIKNTEIQECTKGKPAEITKLQMAIREGIENILLVAENENLG